MMACHAARVIRQRHKAEHDMLDTELSTEQRKVLEDAFGAADKNGDGVLSADEYYDIFQSHGLTIGKLKFFSVKKLCRH
jgi:Ca2+-binding EF-hand superfamily protein